MSEIDIKQINGEYYDFGSGIRNRAQTFQTTAMELKSLGIKNYYFMFKINDPRVASIDPYKKNITRGEILALMQECKTNGWFYMRNIARLRTQQGVLPYGLHRGLAAAAWCFFRNQDACLTEPRQTWKTTGTLGGPIAWAFQTATNSFIHFFGKETDNTKRNLASIKDDILLLPEWFQFRKYYDDDGKVKSNQFSTQTLRNKRLHNEIVIHAKPSSISHAEGMARGASANIMYFDEIEHTPYFDVLLANSSPAFKTAAENALMANLPAARVFSSTPGNLDTREGKTSYPIIKSMVPWTEKIYDMTEEEIQEYKSAYKDTYHQDKETAKSGREVLDCFYIEYQYFQVRKTYDWVLEQYKLSGDRMAVRREILMQRLRGTTESPFSQEDIEYLISHMIKSTEDILIGKKWRFVLYEHGINKTVNNELMPFDKNIPYIVGIDPSGSGSDNTAITIINPKNLKVAAEFRNPYISTTDLVRVIIELVNEYIPKAVLYPERNSMGIAILQMLAESSVRDNLYWSDNDRQVDKLAEESAEEYQMRVAADVWKKYGVYTTKKVRDMMFQILFRHMNEFKDILTSEYVVDDICKLVQTSTGKIEAAKGEHDDSVMSYLIGMYLFYTGDNLEAFGISNKVHPILGMIENEEIYEDDSGFFSTKEVTYEDILLEDNIRVEEENRMLVERFSFIEDPNVRNRPMSNDDGYIPTHFFNEINDLGGF